MAKNKIDKNQKRIAMTIIRKLLDVAIADGYKVNIDNGNAAHVFKEPTGDATLVMDSLFQTDHQESLVFSKLNCRRRYVYLRSPNVGFDVIYDYSMGMTDVIIEVGQFKLKMLSEQQ